MHKHSKEVTALIEALLGRSDITRLTIGSEDPVGFINSDNRTLKAEMLRLAVDEALSEDESVIQAHKDNAMPLGTFFLVHDTDPGECIADYSDNEFCNEVMQVVDFKLGRLGGSGSLSEASS